MASILRPGENVWRIARADRAAVLIDGAPFFRAVRESLMNARHSIFIVGWDIDSRCRLVGEDCTPDDGMPITLGAFLSALALRRPELRIHLLLWDYSVVYALEREPFPTLALHWSTPEQVRLCLDDHLPLGSSHHQKLILVDDALAFSGGLDLTIRRWDTCDHTLGNPDRVDPAGASYRPFHDAQAMVDGEAAKALAELVRQRWANASCDDIEPVNPQGDPWPQSVVPDFAHIRVGIARTLPAFEGQDEVREVEQLFLDSIGSARRAIYIENQFLTSTEIAERLATRLKETPDLEALIVAPQNYTSLIEAHTMRNGRIRFRQILERANAGDRARMLYPQVRCGGEISDTMVHSKVCVIDDRLLRVGSANLNMRSMGADTECDLIFEAETPSHRAGVTRIRNTLLGEHCGADADVIAQSLAKTGSLLKTAEAVSLGGHRLQPIDDGAPDPEEIAAVIEGVADPPRPLLGDEAAGQDNNRLLAVSLPAAGKVALVFAALLALALAWRYTPLAAFAHPDSVRAFLAHAGDTSWTPLLVVGVYVLAGLVAFPVVVLIAVTAAAFGPILGILYAGVGALASAVVTYAIGSWLGKPVVQAILGPRLDRIRRRIIDQGVIAIAAIRLVPVAPFTFVNLAAGASQIRLQDYVAGTILGMAPGVVVISALGHQIFQMLKQPTGTGILLTCLAILAWIAVSIGVQMLVSRSRSA